MINEDYTKLMLWGIFVGFTGSMFSLYASGFITGFGTVLFPIILFFIIVSLFSKFSEIIFRSDLFSKKKFKGWKKFVGN
ncbi:MAG: hypothetical protein IH845_01985 [Nanoarchaeota archaeon]|nr:hypothetical protein [Nanoarchaeota archaeon]